MALTTPEGTVQVWAAPVEENVIVHVDPPLGRVWHVGEGEAVTAVAPAKVEATPSPPAPSAPAKTKRAATRRTDRCFLGVVGLPDCGGDPGTERFVTGWPAFLGTSVETLRPESTRGGGLG